jgi:hypothetical protein
MDVAGQHSQRNPTKRRLLPHVFRSAKSDPQKMVEKISQIEQSHQFLSLDAKAQKTLK